MCLYPRRYRKSTPGKSPGETLTDTWPGSKSFVGSASGPCGRGGQGLRWSPGWAFNARERELQEGSLAVKYCLCAGEMGVRSGFTLPLGGHSPPLCPSHLYPPLAISPSKTMMAVPALAALAPQKVRI